MISMLISVFLLSYLLGFLISEVGKEFGGIRKTFTAGMAFTVFILALVIWAIGVFTGASFAGDHLL